MKKVVFVLVVVLVAFSAVSAEEPTVAYLQAELKKLEEKINRFSEPVKTAYQERAKGVGKKISEADGAEALAKAATEFDILSALVEEELERLFTAPSLHDLRPRPWSGVRGRLVGVLTTGYNGYTGGAVVIQSKTSTLFQEWRWGTTRAVWWVGCLKHAAPPAAPCSDCQEYPTIPPGMVGRVCPPYEASWTGKAYQERNLPSGRPSGEPDLEPAGRRYIWADEGSFGL